MLNYPFLLDCTFVVCAVVAAVVAVAVVAGASSGIVLGRETAGSRRKAGGRARLLPPAAAGHSSHQHAAAAVAADIAPAEGLWNEVPADFVAACGAAYAWDSGRARIRDCNEAPAGLDTPFVLVAAAVAAWKMAGFEDDLEKNIAAAAAAWAY